MINGTISTCFSCKQGGSNFPHCLLPELADQLALSAGFVATFRRYPTESSRSAETARYSFLVQHIQGFVTRKHLMWVLLWLSELSFAQTLSLPVVGGTKPGPPAEKRENHLFPAIPMWSSKKGPLNSQRITYLQLDPYIMLLQWKMSCLLQALTCLYRQRNLEEKEGLFIIKELHLGQPREQVIRHVWLSGNCIFSFQVFALVILLF